MNATQPSQPVPMRPSGVRAPRVLREPTFLLRRPDASPPVARWSCGCEYFRDHRFCAHTLHMDRAARVG